MKKTLLFTGALLISLGIGYSQAKPVSAIVAAHPVAAHPVAAHPAAHAEATHATATHAAADHTTGHVTDNETHSKVPVTAHPSNSAKHHKSQYTKGYDDGYKNGKLDKKTKSYKHRKPSAKASSSYYKGYAHGYKEGRK